jgi:hypothetical protein
MALFPPILVMIFHDPQSLRYDFPIRVEPVAEINGTRLSLVIISPTL